MVRTTGGIGRHRQSWHTVICPGCGTDVQVRRTIHGKPLHIRRPLRPRRPPLPVHRAPRGGPPAPSHGTHGELVEAIAT